MNKEKTILDYLSLDLQMIDTGHPFYYLDALILSVFAYIPIGSDLRNYKGITLNPIGRTLGHYAKLLLETDNLEILKARFISSSKSYTDYCLFLQLIIKNSRYKQIKIIDFSYENCSDCQFAAYVYEINENETVISYRGTDGTYEGWYENFMLLDEDMKAQKLAVALLKRHMIFNRLSQFYLCGHSKGGNLASYAGIKLSPEISRIKNIFNFDGPGFNKTYLKDHNDAIIKIAPKSEAYYIENTVVGELLFGQKELYKQSLSFVRAAKQFNLLWQHFPFTWIIHENLFLPTRQSIFSIEVNIQLDLIVTIVPSSKLKGALMLFFDILTEFKDANAKSIKQTLSYYVHDLLF